MRRTDITLLLALAVLWGASFCFARQALLDLPPLSVAAARFGLGGLIFAPVLLAARQRLPRGWRTWRDFLAMGVLNNLLPFGLIVLGQQWIGAGMAAILNSTAPLFSALIAPLLVAEERAGALRLIGVTLGIAGVALLAGPAALGQAGYPWWALLPGLGAALSYALAAIWGLRFRGLPVVSIAASQVMSAAVLGLPLALLVDRPWTLHVSLPTWAALLGMALFTTVLGYLIYFRLLVRGGPTNALLVTFLIPPAAAALEAAVRSQPALAGAAGDGDRLPGHRLRRRPAAGTMEAGAGVRRRPVRQQGADTRSSSRPSEPASASRDPCRSKRRPRQAERWAPGLARARPG